MDFDLNRTPGFEKVVADDEESIAEVKIEPITPNCEEDEPTDECANAPSIAAELEVGTIFESIEQVYVLYCEYARCKGFGVRKVCQRYFDNSSELRMKMFNCSCEGFKDNKRCVGRTPAYRRQDIRSNCKARIRVLRDRNGPWRISIFHKKHNHELLDMDQTYLLRSARHLSAAKRYVLETLLAAGIPVSKACKFMEKESEGPENVGFTRKDVYNHNERMKSMTKIENGDAKTILELFTEKSMKEPCFFWKIQLDDNGRMLNFFCWDSRSVVDYDYFGDVVSFDTTYKTNKYNMVCAPFIGMNHHYQNVMFGLGFLSDEMISSFKWLFKSFLESMYGKEPEVMFTDQCQALKNGLEHTFESTTHRFCQWHINHNAPSHFGSLNGDKQFKKQWDYCMNGYETVEDFEEKWRDMMNTYDLRNNKWFSTMYNLRRKWSSVFTNDQFTAGLHATSRSEVTNRVLKDLGNRSNTLFEFVKHFFEVQDDWRQRERAEDAACRGMPGQIIDGNCLLTHIGSVFTRNIFKLFEIEATQSMNIELLQYPVDYFAHELEFVVRSG